MVDSGVLVGDVADFVAINGPANVVRGPLHGVGVPVVVGVELVGVLVRLLLVVAVAVDHVHAERVVLHRGHDLDIELVPLSGLKVGAIPVGEEGGHGSLLIGGLHAGHELTVREFLVTGN